MTSYLQVNFSSLKNKNIKPLMPAFKYPMIIWTALNRNAQCCTWKKKLVVAVLNSMCRKSSLKISRLRKIYFELEKSCSISFLRMSLAAELNFKYFLFGSNLMRLGKFLLNSVHKLFNRENWPLAVSLTIETHCLSYLDSCLIYFPAARYIIAE